MKMVISHQLWQILLIFWREHAFFLDVLGEVESDNKIRH